MIWVYQNFWVCYICLGFFHTHCPRELVVRKAGKLRIVCDLVFLMTGKSVLECGRLWAVRAVSCFSGQEVFRTWVKTNLVPPCLRSWERESLQHVGELFMWQTVESKAERGRCWRDMTAREALKELS